MMVLSAITDSRIRVRTGGDQHPDRLGAERKSGAGSGLMDGHEAVLVPQVQVAAGRDDRFQCSQPGTRGSHMRGRISNLVSGVRVGASS